MHRSIIATLSLMIFSSVSMAAETLYFPQVVDGGGYTTTFTIMNPHMQWATGTVRLTDSNGNPWPMTLADGRNVSQFPISVPALGSTRFAGTGQGPIKTGWASLTTEISLSGVETIDYHPGSNLLDSVSVACRFRILYPALHHTAGSTLSRPASAKL